VVTAFARYALECRAVGVVKVLESGRLRLTLEGCCMVAGWMHTCLSQGWEHTSLSGEPLPTASRGLRHTLLGGLLQTA